MMSSLEPSLDTWTIIFLVVALHGFALSIIFSARKKGKRLPNRLLGLFLFLFSLKLLTFVAYWTRYNLEFPHIMGVSATFPFLFGPILFLYALSIVKSSKNISRWHFLHFVPFLIYAAYLFPVYLLPAEQKASIIQEALQSTYELSNSARIVTTIKFLHMAVYGGLIINLRRVKKYFKIDFQKISEQKKSWIRFIKYSFAGYLFAYMSFFLTVDLIGYSLEFDYGITFAMSLFIFGIGYYGLTRPDYLYDAHNGSKYENSTLMETDADQYLEQLLSYMEEEKPYINGDLKLEDLSDELNIPRHHLSQVINERLGKNFFEFINTYRVREAKKILCDPDSKNYKILRVAFESGFNNKTTFNSAFKSEVGTTPSKFRKEQEQHSNGKIIHS